MKLAVSILVCIGVILGLLGFFWRRGQKQKADALASNEDFSWGQFLSDNAVDIALSLGLYVCGIFGINLGETIPSIPVGITFVTAIVFGGGLPQTVSNYLLPLIGAGDKARKRNRKAVDEKTNELDRLKKSR